MICLGAIALHEFYSIIENKGLKPYKLIGVFLFCATQASIYSVYCLKITPLLPITLLSIGFIILHFFVLKDPKQATHSLSTTIYGIVYLMFGFTPLLLIAYFIPERYDISARIWITFLFLNTKLSDVLAYLVGKNFGKRKLCKEVSPGKTWEGTLGTLLGGLISPFLVLPFFTLPSSIPLNLFILFSVFLAFIGLLGDLSESLFKRDAGVKDSNTIPGLGGILDIFDSIIFSAPLLYLFLITML